MKHADIVKADNAYREARDKITKAQEVACDYRRAVNDMIDAISEARRIALEIGDEDHLIEWDRAMRVYSEMSP